MKPMKPIFNPKRLPIDEYIPLSLSNLSAGMKFAPVEFKVTRESHEKTVSLLENSDLEGKTKILHPFLFPSELWGTVRNLNPYFGRLKEIAFSKAKFELFGRTAMPGEILNAKSRIVKVGKKRGLPLAAVETETRNSNGELLMKSIVELVLLHDVNCKFYHEKNEESSFPSDPILVQEKKIYRRHDWNPEEWKASIHHDEYAKKFGYARGLPEFKTYMDHCFTALLMLEKEGAYNRAIEIKKALPVYDGEKIRLFVERKGKGYKISIFRGSQERIVHSVK